MNTLFKFLKLEFFPRNGDAGWLLLRLWVALPMLFLHGLAKIQGFSTMASQFPDPFGIGSTPSLALAVSSEALGSVLLALGLFTRIAALGGIATMGVAFLFAHKGALSGPASGELAFVYLGAYVAILISGGGRYALDSKLR